MHTIGKMLFVIAGLTAMFLCVRFLVYGISDHFALGLGTGVILGFGLATIYARWDRQDAEQSELARNLHRTGPE